MPPATAVIVSPDAIVPRDNPLVRRLPPRGTQLGHHPACSCCRPRTALAETLHGLFVARARGSIPWFDRVELRLDPDAETMAVFSEPLVAERFVLVRGMGEQSGARGNAGAGLRDELRSV
ncbi:MAG: hypothetical protein NZ523_12985 [Elioraea sp.]|nr:hypothetical protein [Elioraea sp.]